jgi:hypothetical protein
MTTKTRLVLPLLVLAALVSAPASANDKDEAKKLFEAGLKLMKMDDFGAAAANFERATSLFPTQNSLFNLANCYRALQRYGDALGTLERLRRDFGTVLKPEIQEAATRQERELVSLVARLTIRVAPCDGNVSVDGKNAPSETLRVPIVLAPGEHTIAATCPGYRPQQRTVQLVSGKEETVLLELEPETAQPALATLPPNPPPASVQPADVTAPLAEQPAPKTGSRALRVVAWSALGAAVAAGIVAGSFRVIADGHYSDFQKYNTGKPEDFAMRDAASSDTQSANNIAIGLGITAAALAVTAGVTYLLGRESSKPAAEAPSVALTPTGVAVSF